MSRTSKYYYRNKPNGISPAMARATLKIEQLNIRQQIYTIDEQLRILDECIKMCPPPKAAKPPFVVHSAPSSDQEI